MLKPDPKLILRPIATRRASRLRRLRESRRKSPVPATTCCRPGAIRRLAQNRRSSKSCLATAGIRPVSNWASQCKPSLPLHFAKKIGVLHVRPHENREREDVSASEQGVTYIRPLEQGLFSQQLAAAITRALGNIGNRHGLGQVDEPGHARVRSPLNLQFRWARPSRMLHRRDPEGLLATARELEARVPPPRACGDPLPRSRGRGGGRARRVARWRSIAKAG